MFMLLESCTEPDFSDVHSNVTGSPTNGRQIGIWSTVFNTTIKQHKISEMELYTVETLLSDPVLSEFSII